MKVYFVCNLIIDASISEKFYDLKRYSSDSRGIWKSLAIMVIVSTIILFILVLF